MYDYNDIHSMGILGNVKDTELGELSTSFTKWQHERKEKHVNNTHEGCKLN